MASEMALLLLQLASEDGGRIDPQRIRNRPLNSTSVTAFTECLNLSLVDAFGYITPMGYEELREWNPDECEGVTDDE